MDLDSLILGGCAGWFVGFLSAVVSILGMASRQDDTEN